MSNLLQVIKQAAMDAVEASDPSDFLFGTVKSSSPLVINLEQKLDLTSGFLLLTSNVRDYEVKITVDMNTDDGEHSVTGEQTITVHNGLKTGDKVILIKQKGGQKYIVLDKLL